MSYLSPEMAYQAIEKMKNFHDKLQAAYEENGMNFLEDIGRRNILMSRPQEKFFAAALSTVFSNTTSDGRTGQPDILIPDLGKELECKITSPHRSGGWSLQTDYGTLQKKGKLDYLYVLCDRNFEDFAVFHFEDLTIDDFKEPASGSRGKSSIIMSRAIHKCNILVGDIENRNQIFLESISEKLTQATLTLSQKEKLLSRQKYWAKAPASFSFKLEAA
jgi:hypothetical protein